MQHRLGLEPVLLSNRWAGSKLGRYWQLAIVLLALFVFWCVQAVLLLRRK